MPLETYQIKKWDDIYTLNITLNFQFFLFIRDLNFWVPMCPGAMYRRGMWQPVGHRTQKYEIYQ